MKKKRIIATPLQSLDKIDKPNTVTRAGITADIKMTRGKQLVEHNPFNLIPDPQNPRPGEVVDDTWLKLNLKLGTDDSLCKVNSEGTYIIPDFSDLDIGYSNELKESYDFLKSLAFSIRREGLIEPIEIFLADKKNEPTYFEGSDLSYGYVVLEGHQRRLAAMMAGVKTVTCVEITDETMLAKLKVKHRKIRRQLSENNLRKGLTVYQNFVVVQQLLQEQPESKITASELSEIIGLNEDIAAALKKLANNFNNYPQQFIEMLKNNQFTFSNLRTLVGKSNEYINKFISKDHTGIEKTSKKTVKTRGRSGGAIKKSATFKVNLESNSILLRDLLASRFPEVEEPFNSDNPYKSLEEMLTSIMHLATNE